MTLPPCYAGKILRVNLTTGKISEEPLKEDLVKAFVGGRGLGAKYLFDEISPGIDPLSPENILIFMTGPLNGLPVPCAGKHVVISKSPATNTFLDCYAGGFFGVELKFTGFDGIIIHGKAEKLSYLLITDGKAEIRSAEHLKGKPVDEVTNILREDNKIDDLSVAAIGPAGENLVRMACITNDLYHQAARGGIGAVMGSKNLKAIAVKGTKDLNVPDMDKFLEVAEEAIVEAIKNPEHEWALLGGTPEIVDLSQEVDVLPTKNFQYGEFEKASEINWNAIKKKIFIKKVACFSCPLGCRNLVEVREGPFKGTVLEGPEYETLALTGSNCGISDLNAIAKFNLLCDFLGLDTISTGNVVAFAMECYEKGLITKEDTGGLELTFGNVDAYIKMPELIARREGIGAILADGVKIAAEKIDKGAEKYAVHVKGLEYPGYDPRGSIGMALAYATADRGACHLRSWVIAKEAFGDLDPFTTEGKAAEVIDDQDRNSIKWSLILCDFYAADYAIMVKLLSAATGIQYSENELKLMGERIWNLTRAFNIREGFTRKDDTLPPRIMEESLPTGKAKGRRVTKEDFEKMLDEYYKLRGWTKDGIPTLEKLKQLGLNDVAEKLGLK